MSMGICALGDVQGLAILRGSSSFVKPNWPERWVVSVPQIASQFCAPPLHPFGVDSKRSKETKFTVLLRR